MRALAFALAALAALALMAAATWADLDSGTRAALGAAATSSRLALLAFMLVPALAVLGWAAVRGAARLRAQAARMAEGVALIAGANAAHRVVEPGVAELDAIARAVNAVARERARLLGDARASIERATARAADERNRLGALIAELEQSVLVCNLDGRILLYNAAVVALLGRKGGAGAPPGSGAAHAVGLGRSAYAIVAREAVAHAVEAIEGQAARGEREGAQFVTATADARLLRVNVAPVRGAAAAGAARPLTGFVLLLADVTEEVERDARSVALYQGLVEATRSSIANIRAAIETMIAHPDLEAAQRARFAHIVQSEAVRLSERLDSLTTDVSARLQQRWPLEQIRGADLLALAGRRIERRAGLAVALDAVDAGLWLRADSFSLVQVLTSLSARLHEEFAVRDVRLGLVAVDDHAHLDLAWKGVPMSSETAFTWQNDAYTLGGETSPLSLAQVLERHGGEAWYRRDTPSQTNYFRMLLPRAAQSAAAEAPSPVAPERPEFYDFDLFERSPASDALDERRLDQLAYTAFDTETTGLEPDRGDEIIAIGAVRIVNGRLLRSETFDALVDPRRPIAPASIAVHGITPERLAGQPAIDEVLPRFWRFAEDTVLVGHNAAFDMRFLQLKEARTGVRFAQPVLDTLLLAAVAAPSESSHALEALAERLGVEVVGRHTALGDAQTTANIFLRLMPLLAAQGIHTLGAARAASQRTYYARLTY